MCDVLSIGDESQADVLRMLTATELYMNSTYYASHPNICAIKPAQGKFSQSTYFATILTEDALKVYDLEGNKEMASKKEALTCINRNWAAFIHRLALTNVINQRIFSIYPETNAALRPLFHREIVPYKPAITNTTVMILWSRDGSVDKREGAVYEPTHYVPVQFIVGFEDEWEIKDVQDPHHSKENVQESAEMLISYVPDENGIVQASSGDSETEKSGLCKESSRRLLMKTNQYMMTMKSPDINKLMKVQRMKVFYQFFGRHCAP